MVLLKAKGKCTTDHISAAGPWLKYRGHLTNISQNLFLTAVNAFTEQPGQAVDQLDGGQMALPALAAKYRSRGQGWVAIGDENYGEGSSREHAAMEPRLQGCRAVIVRSFARIHETNLKKQGILPLVFKQPSDYDLFGQADRVSVIGLAGLAPGKPVEVVIKKTDGTTQTIQTTHTMTDEQIGWFKAGSALNALK